MALLAAIVVSVLHHVDHVLRADYSGWPFSGEVTLFSASLLVYPLLLAAVLLSRTKSWMAVGLVAVLLVAVQVPHMFVETPADQYSTWAEGVSSVPRHLGRPNLLGIASSTLGVASVMASLLLSAALAVALVLVAGLLRRGRRLVRAAVVSAIVVLVSADLAYGWAWLSTGSSELARSIAWQESDVLDYQRFTARPVETQAPAFHFPEAPRTDQSPVQTVPVRDGGEVVERDLEEFLRSTGTTAFLVLEGDTLVYEAYFNGHRRESTVSSFSVAKSVVSALVGIAVEEGHINSLDDPVTAYLPELAERDGRFARITLRHLLSMSSGLGDLDPYYSVDMRAVALHDTEVDGPPGERFSYNNVNAVLLGLVIERATGRSVSAYLEDTLWGPLGMEADGSWSLDSEASGFELMQAGLNGRAIDFAKFGALYLNDGQWRGRQLVPRDWVAESTRADTESDPSPDYQTYWWTRPGSGTPNDFWAQGNHGQFIYASPSHDAVLVRFGIEYGYEYWPELLAELASRY